MTRKEAALIHAKNMGCTVDNAELFVKSLEALGVITFEDKKYLDHMVTVAFQQYKMLNAFQRKCLKNAIFIFDGE